MLYNMLGEVVAAHDLSSHYHKEKQNVVHTFNFKCDKT